MAIRDVGGGAGPKPQVGAGAAGGLPANVERGLNDAGLVKGGQTAKDAAQTLVSNLKGAGFDPGPAKDVVVQLSTSLKSFQGQNALTKTGQLDPATQAALKNAGIIKNEAAPATQKTPAQEKDGFDRGATLLKQGEKSRADVVNNASPDTNFLDALINQLGPGGPSEGMSASDVKGAAEASEAQAKADAKVSETKKGEGVNKKGSTTDAQKEPEGPSNQQLDKANSSGVKVARGLKTDNAQTDEKRRKDALQGHDPTEAGILAEEADEDALEGAGDDGKKRRGQGGDHDGGGDEGGDDAGTESGERDGDERDQGKHHSGDTNYNEAGRGGAVLDDGSGVDEGHYRVPSMSEQAAAALDKIVRDAQVENRATTYSWDVTFYRPGVYARGQRAQEIVHLVVDKATAFDPVWSKAQANIAILVKRLDQGGSVPSLDDIIAALRQARARDGDLSAAKIGKVTKPMGRA